jgi:tryptophanyl-tRNA synthetase
MGKKRIFSGIKPSGDLHLGNYLGAIRQWIALQDEYDAVFSVVDLHAITVSQDPKELHAKTLEIAKIYLAAGIDPKKCTLFIQSHVKEHTELCWILNTITKNGDLTKMTQFKDKALADFEKFEKTLDEMSGDDYKAISEEARPLAEQFSSEQVAEIAKQSSFKTVRHFFQIFKENFNSVGVGFYDYPVLMAADIVLYDTDVVPVGEDQVQHVELARTLARRFNDRFGETFTIPEARVAKEAARIMRLDDPAKKMSKSAASEYGYIALTDDADLIRKKIKKAVTDSAVRSCIATTNQRSRISSISTRCSRASPSMRSRRCIRAGATVISRATSRKSWSDSSCRSRSGSQPSRMTRCLLSSAPAPRRPVPLLPPNSPK